MASFTVRIFSASSSGISMSKASSKAMTSSTVSSESAPRSSTKEALGVTSPSSTPSCSTMICFTLSSTAAIRLLLLLLVELRSWSRLLLYRLGVLFKVLNGLSHGQDTLRLLVGDRYIKSLFKSHDQLYRVQRIRAQVRGKGRSRRDLSRVHAELVYHDLFDSFLNGRHLQGSPK